MGLGNGAGVGFDFGTVKGIEGEELEKGLVVNFGERLGVLTSGCIVNADEDVDAVGAGE